MVVGSVVRPRVIEAAIQLFGLHGFRGVNMRELAKAARTTPGTVYRLFRSDRKLYAVAVNTAINRALEAVAKSVFVLVDNPDKEDALAMVGKALKLWYDSLGQAEARLLVQVEIADALHRKLARTPVDKMASHVAKSLHAALPETKLEMLAIANCLLGALVQMKISEQGSDTEQAERLVGQFVLLLDAKPREQG
jgi:AcrR family transcriptional regulator